MKWRRLRNLRINRGLTLEVAAKRIGISVAYLSMLERGLRVPAPAIAKDVADFYGEQPTDFWDFDTEPTREAA